MTTIPTFHRFQRETNDDIAAAILTLAEKFKASQPDTLTTEQAADILGCLPKTVRSMCSDGRLRSHRVGRGRGTIRIVRDDLESYMKEPRA